MHLIVLMRHDSAIVNDVMRMRDHDKAPCTRRKARSCLPTLQACANNYDSVANIYEREYYRSTSITKVISATLETLNQVSCMK